MARLIQDPPSTYKGVIAVISRPRQPSTTISTIFAERFQQDLGLEWTFIDPIGKRHTVRYQNCLINPTLGDGWLQMRTYYSLVGANWCLLKYRGESLFDIFVYNTNGKEISYQRPTLSFDEANQHPPLIPIVASLTTWKYYPCFCTLNLTPYQASSNQLHLPIHISYYLRDCGVFKWNLKGPSGIQVECVILALPWRKDAKIGEGWGEFRSRHGFQAGQAISLLFSSEDIRDIDVIVHMNTT